MTAYLITAKQSEISLGAHRAITGVSFVAFLGAIAMTAIGGLKLTHPDLFPNITKNAGIGILVAGIVALLGSVLFMAIRLEKGYKETEAAEDHMPTIIRSADAIRAQNEYGSER